MDEVQPETKIYRSRPNKEIPKPKLPFEKFLAKFQNLGELMETEEWQQIHSYYYNFEDLELEIDLQETAEEIENYDLDRQAEELQRCADSFAYFCIKYVKIAHPGFGIIRFVPYTYQRDIIRCYGTNRFNILSKFRQGGLTTISVLWALWRCLFKTGQRIMVVSKTDREAIAAGQVAKLAIDYLPEWLQPSKSDKSNEHEKEFSSTNSVLWFYTVEAIRGKSLTVLIIDEAAFIDDMPKHWRSAGPTLASSTTSCCEVISTCNGVGNWYYDMYADAETGKNSFHIINIDYWTNPVYNDPAWITKMRKDLGKRGFAQEIERSFLQSGATWMDSGVIGELMAATRDKIPFKFMYADWRNEHEERQHPWSQGALWIWEKPLSEDSNHEYIISVDAAGGENGEGDNSCFEVIDGTTMVQVAEFYSAVIHPHVFAQLVQSIGMYYNTALIVVENEMFGQTVSSVLQHDLGYEHLYYEDGKDQSGIKPTKNKRAMFLQSLQEKLLNRTLKINSARFAHELSTFISKNKKPQAERSRHDDAIIAMAMACYVKNENVRSAPMTGTVDEERMQIFKTKIYQDIRREIMDENFIDEFMDEKKLEEFMMVNGEENGVRQRRWGGGRLGRLKSEFGW